MHRDVGNFVAAMIGGLALLLWAALPFMIVMALFFATISLAAYLILGP